MYIAPTTVVSTLSARTKAGGAVGRDVIRKRDASMRLIRLFLSIQSLGPIYRRPLPIGLLQPLFYDPLLIVLVLPLFY